MKESLARIWESTKRLSGHFLNNFFEKRLLLKAAALSYTTVLCLLPLLAIMFSVSNVLLAQMHPEVTDRIIDTLLVRLVPQVELLDQVSPGVEAGARKLPTKTEIRTQIKAFLQYIGSGNVGVVGVVSLIFLSLSLFITIEHTLNDIWEVHEGRSLMTRVSLYWTVMTLGLIMVLSVIIMTNRWQATRLMKTLENIPYFFRFLHFITPFVLFWIGLTFIYTVIPHTRVPLGAALIGAVFGGTLLQLNNLLNAIYVFNVISAERLYGGFGIIPIFFLGIYVAWFLVLVGANLTCSIQTLTESDGEDSSSVVAPPMV